MPCSLQVAEQAAAYLLHPEEHMHGLNLINSTNLDYFQPQHQAEMINLKAQFLEALGEHDAGGCGWVGGWGGGGFGAGHDAADPGT